MRIRGLRRIAVSGVSTERPFRLAAVSAEVVHERHRVVENGLINVNPAKAIFLGEASIDHLRVDVAATEQRLQEQALRAVAFIDCDAIAHSQ